jgi:hypothetical protein
MSAQNRLSAKRPHAAVIKLQINVHPVLDSGECDGITIDTGTLSEYGVKPVQVVTLRGQNRHDLLVKLSRWLGERPDAR